MFEHVTGMFKAELLRKKEMQQKSCEESHWNTVSRMDDIQGLYSAH
jgi:hypothetical protein